MDQKWTLKVIADGEMQELSVQDGAILSDALAQAGFDAPTPCGGNGKCGKCRLRASGGLTPAPDANGACLSCQTKVTGDAIVWLGVPRAMEAIESAGILPEFEHKPRAGKYGLAVDIGTTTLAAQLVSLEDGRVLETVASENPQRLVAHDVIGRIQAAMDGKSALLKDLIRAELQRMEEVLCVRAGVERTEISARVCTGNTTMLYLLTGRDPVSLSAAPFEADCLFGFEENGAYLPACFGAYVGADILCALQSCDILARHRTAMLIDIGTNGEIALLHEGKLYCCATAAGPAFEGVGISCGVSSVRGAIESAWVEDGALRIHTIGDAEPVGICGSGLIDLTAALLETEELDETGFMEDDVELAPGVSLTPKDVRMVQLAKGSICAGMRTLMDMAGVCEDDIETLYLAGGFGRHINLRSAIRIGLIPEFREDQVQVVGNAALTGALLNLLNCDMPQKAQALLERAECINLAQSPKFQMLYPECMMFPEE